MTVHETAASQPLPTFATIANTEAAIRDLNAIRRAFELHAFLSVTDAEGIITEVNDNFCTVSGYNRSELLGRNHRFLKSGKHSKSFWLNVWRTITTGRAWRGEICNRHKSGALYWLDTTIVPIVDHEGRIERYLAIRFDISDRKRAEVELIAATEEIQEQHARVDLALASGNIGLWDWNPQTGIVTFDSRWAEMLGEQVGDLTGSVDEWVRRVHPDDLPRANTALAAHFAGETVQYECEHRLRHRDGTWRWILARGKVITRDENRQPLRVVGTHLDVTEARQLREMAEAANAAKSEFLANMSHEIRTPLTAILGYTDQLIEDGEIAKAPKRRVDTISTIKRAGEHLLTIVNDILDLSKIDAGKMRLEEVESDLPSLLIEIESLSRPRAAGKGLRFDLEIATPIPEKFRTDPTRFRQILLNLIGNAIKFTEQGTITVTLSVNNGDSLIYIDIRDTGSGIPDDQLGHLFQPFMQADLSVSRKHGGTGLGLTICRRLARLLNGDVNLLATRPGLGSTFQLRLPLVVATKTAWVTSLKRTEPPKQEEVNKIVLRGRILLAEDGPDNQRLISFILRKAGATVDVAENGRIALEMLDRAELESRSYDLLVTDIQMPELDGYALVRTLRSNGSEMPIIALTAHAMAEDRRKCIEAGCDEYATKPIDRAVLLTTCARLLDKVNTPS